MTTVERSAARRGNRIAAVLMLASAGSAGVAATGTFPVVFLALGLVLTIVALSFAIRGQLQAR